MSFQPGARVRHTGSLREGTVLGVVEREPDEDEAARGAVGMPTFVSVQPDRPFLPGKPVTAVTWWVGDTEAVG